MGFWDKEKEILQVEKAGTKASYYSFKEVSKGGRDFIDVREHFTKADGTAQHTTKGMSIPKEVFSDVMSGFRDVHDILNQGGTN